MNAIIKNDNVYVVVRNKEVKDGEGLINSGNLIIDNSSRRNNSLYGGRVKLEHYSGTWRISIDGINIEEFYIRQSSGSNYTHTFVERKGHFDLEKIASFLNQIENLGIDSFEENYKIHLQTLKKELETITETWQQELAVENSNNKRHDLDELRKTLLAMSCLIFSLLINMNAGLSNQHYTNAYDTVINMYF